MENSYPVIMRRENDEVSNSTLSALLAGHKCACGEAAQRIVTRDALSSRKVVYLCNSCYATNPIVELEPTPP
jgi:predicted SprT family Zn-dependent metalloprotease